MTAPVIMKLRRAELEARIEDLIDLLDVLDGDCDLEDNGDLEPSLSSQGLAGANGIEYDLELDDSDREPNGDEAEPELGWSNPGGLRLGVPRERKQLLENGWMS